MGRITIADVFAEMEDNMENLKYYYFRHCSWSQINYLERQLNLACECAENTHEFEGTAIAKVFDKMYRYMFNPWKTISLDVYVIDCYDDLSDTTFNDVLYHVMDRGIKSRNGPFFVFTGILTSTNRPLVDNGEEVTSYDLATYGINLHHYLSDLVDSQCTIHFILPAQNCSTGRPPMNVEIESDGSYYEFDSYYGQECVVLCSIADAHAYEDFCKLTMRCHIVLYCTSFY